MVFTAGGAALLRHGLDERALRCGKCSMKRLTVTNSYGPTNKLLAGWKQPGGYLLRLWDDIMVKNDAVSVQSEAV